MAKRKNNYTKGLDGDEQPYVPGLHLSPKQKAAINQRIVAEHYAAGRRPVACRRKRVGDCDVFRLRYTRFDPKVIGRRSHPEPVEDLEG